MEHSTSCNGFPSWWLEWPQFPWQPTINEVPIANKRFAAIDIGTNSAHLVVAEFSDNGDMRILDTDKTALRLGEALDDDGNLPDEAIQRTVDTVAHMQEIARGRKAKLRAVATHATREALNYKDLLKKVYGGTGVRIDIIEGVEEARLVYLGMRYGLSIDNETCLGVDVGGGSTEIIVARDEDIRFATSVKLGAVVLTKRFLKQRPTDDDVDRLRNHVRARIAPVKIVTEPIPYSIAAASSGTAKALAVIHANTNAATLSDPNGYKLPARSVNEIVEELRKLRSPQAIREVFNVDESRADIILAGSIILDEVGRCLDVEEWHVSGRGLREGIVIDTYGQKVGSGEPRRGNVRWSSIVQFGKRTGLYPPHCETMARLCTEIYHSLKSEIHPDEGNPTETSELLLLQAAAYLHECGKFVSAPKFHRHSEYLIANSPLPGFTQAERKLIANVTRFQRKSIPTAKNCPDLTPRELRQVRFLSGILRLASALDRSRRNRVKGIETCFSPEDGHLRMTIRYKKKLPADLELLKAEMEKEPLERSFGVTILFEGAPL